MQLQGEFSQTVSLKLILATEPFLCRSTYFARLQDNSCSRRPGGSATGRLRRYSASRASRALLPTDILNIPWGRKGIHILACIPIFRLAQKYHISTKFCFRRCSASSDGNASPQVAEIHEQFREQDIPIPIIKIDNKTDNFATVVSMEFGDQLGELLDTVGTICIPLLLLL